MIPPDMPHGAKVMLYQLGFILKCKAMGAPVDCFVELSPKGWEAYRELKASGFKPSDLETEMAFQMTTSGQIRGTLFRENPSDWPDTLEEK